MLLRALREPRTGHPSPLARLLAIMIVLGMVAVSAPVLFPAVRWIIGLF